MVLGNGRFPVELGSVSRAIDFVVSTCSNYGIEVQSLSNLLLACDELLTNVCVHGYPAATREAFVNLTIDFDGDFVSVCLEDTGLHFSPTDLDPDCNFSLDSLVIGGVGLYLVLKLLDHFEHYERGNRNINILKSHASRKNTAQPTDPRTGL
jgi:serine/threonine-protein kinase RsbW